MHQFVWAVLLFPLAGFLINSFGTRMSNRMVSLVGPGSVFLAFLSAVVCFFWLQSKDDAARRADDIGWTWSVAGAFHLNFGLLLDPLSSTMSLVITGVGFLILVYAVGYM